MNTIEIKGIEILKINNKIPIIFSKLFNNISYEWYYIEIFNENSHIVCILHLNDCFIQEKSDKEQYPSIYLTWYQNDKIIAYSYSFYEGNEKQKFKDKIIKWLEFEIPVLDLWIPDHSLEKYIHLSLENPIHNIQYEKKEQAIEIDKTKHYWQFIKYANVANGKIEIFSLNKEFLINEKIKRFSHFFDLPLTSKLKKVTNKRSVFKNATLYFDHNAGFQPLYNIKKNWYWWHAKESDKFEIAYFFPKNKSMFYITGDSYNENSQILNIDEKEICLKKSISKFGIRYPKKIKSLLFNEIHFRKTIESAPFYLRKSSNKIITSTIEFLNPQKILNKFNQILLNSRKLHIFTDIRNKDDLSISYTFENICKKVTWENGKSFYLSSLVLTLEQRNSAYFIYTICRIIDDATDEKNNFDNEISKGINFSNQFLDTLWSEDINLSDSFMNNLRHHISHCLFSIIDKDSAINFLYISKEKIKYLDINKVYFQELIAGQLMDENFLQPKNLNDFNLYCYRVAGVVGIMMAKIFRTPKNEAALYAAEKLGAAMQITNILRDIKEDYDMQRIYLPLSLFIKYEIDNSSLFSSNQLDIDKKFKIIHELSEQAISGYRLSLDGIKFIPSFRARLCVKLMIAIYGSILGKILINKNIIFKKRVVISHLKKIIILLKVILGQNPLKVAKLTSKKDIYGKI